MFGTDRVGDKQQQIGDFVRRFLTSFGADLMEREGWVEARLPQDLADGLGVDGHLAVVLDAPDSGGCREEVEAPDGTAPEFVTFGHPLLDRMLELAKSRGDAAGFLFTPALDPDLVQFALSTPLFDTSLEAPSHRAGSAGDALVRAVRRTPFANARGRIHQGRLVHQAQVLFRFKVSFVSDEKRETMLTLLVDPVSEEVDRLVDLGGAVSFTPHIETGGGERSVYAIRRLYRRACEHLAERIAPMAEAFESDVNRRMKRELHRIDEYYRSLIEERLEPLRNVFRKMSVAGMRVDMARTWQTHVRYSEQIGKLRSEADDVERLYKEEVRGLNRERERLAQEVREKHHPRVEVALSQGAYVMVPRFEWNVRLSGAVRREATLLYDVLRRKFVGHNCECCEEPFLGPVYLCGCEDMVCESCHAECRQCGLDLCPSCAADRCHVCGDPVCPKCDTSCPLDTAFGSLDLPHVCTACRETACRTCQPLSTLHLNAAL